MKKIFTIAKVALGLLFAGVGLNASAVDYITVTAGQSFEVSANQWAYFTPTVSGVMTITNSVNNILPSVFKNFTEGAEDDGTAVNPIGDPETTGDSASASYEVIANVKLCFASWSYVSGTYTISVQADNGDVDDSGFDQMQMGQLYNSSPLKLKYTAPANGMLTIEQKGSYDTMLFSKPETNVNGQNAITPDNGAYTGTNPYTLKYSLVADQTVYFMSPNTYTGSISEVTFSWEASGAIPEIKDNTEFDGYQTLMTYTPSKDGELTITISNSTVWADWWNDGGSGLLFTNPSHDQKVNLTLGETNDNGGTLTAILNGNQTYYFYNDYPSGKDAKFTFSLADLPTPALAEVNPAPGAIDAGGDFGNGVIVGFYPTSVEFTGASISYIDADGKQVNEVLTLGENGLEGDDYAWNRNGTWKFQAVSYAYNGYTPNSQVGTNGKTWVPAGKGESIVLTLKGCNYNGVPVSVNNTGENDGIQIAADGTVTLTWGKPAIDVAIENQKWPETIYAEPTTDDPNMYAKVAFNMNLSTSKIPSVSYVFGSQTYGAGSGGDNPDPGDDIPAKNVTVSGNTITIDFNGIDFGAKYAEGSKQYTQITFFVGNLFSYDGQKIQIDNPGLRNVCAFNSGEAPEVELLGNPEVAFDNIEQAVILYWDEAIQPAVAGADIFATIQGPRVSNSVQMSLIAYNPEGSDATATETNALMAYLADLISQNGGGQYTITLDAASVKNLAGNMNGTFSTTFDVPEPAQKATNVTFNYDSDKDLITISWGDYTIAEADKENTALYIEDEEGVLIDLMAKNAVTITSSAITINLSGLGLTTGTGYTLVIPEDTFVLGDNITNATVDQPFTYGSSESVTYMSRPSLAVDGDVLFVYWTETILEIENAELAAVLTTPDGNNVNVTFSSITTYAPNVEDTPNTGDNNADVDVNNALLLNLANVISKYGYGQYNISFGTIVMNEEGAINNTFSGAFTVTEPADVVEGIVTPVLGYTFYLEEEVVFTIAYDGKVELNPEADEDPLLVYNSAEYDETYSWEDNEVIFIDSANNSVIINLGNELEAGTYYLSFREGQLLVDGTPNAGIYDYEFIVSSDTLGVNGIGVEDLKGGVYNLNGVKVGNDLNKLAKGIYIINGKKVLIRK